MDRDHDPHFDRLAAAAEVEVGAARDKWQRKALALNMVRAVPRIEKSARSSDVALGLPVSALLLGLDGSGQERRDRDEHNCADGAGEPKDSHIELLVLCTG